MRESLLFSIIIRTARFMLWACLSMVIILPSTKIYAQDDVEDVEEFFGDDDEDEYYDDEDEYLDDDEYEDDEYYDDEDEYYDDEEFEDDEDYDEELSDEAENLGYTIDLAMGSPRFTNPVLMAWNSNVDLRASVEFPVLMQVMGARFRFGVEVGSFKFENAKFNQDNPAIQIGETFSGITAMGIVSFPAGPGKIKVGLGMVGSSAGFSMEASYGIRIGGMVELRAGIRSTETLMAKTSESAELGRAGWMDGQIVLGVNL